MERETASSEPALSWTVKPERQWVATANDGKNLTVSQLPNGKYQLQVESAEAGQLGETIFSENDNHFLVEAERRFQSLLEPSAPPPARRSRTRKK